MATIVAGFGSSSLRERIALERERTYKSPTLFSIKETLKKWDLEKRID
jgi:hypothetical protein